MKYTLRQKNSKDYANKKSFRTICDDHIHAGEAETIRYLCDQV